MAAKRKEHLFKNDEELNEMREALLEHFRYERSLRQVIGSRNIFGSKLQGRLADPGEYLVKITVGGENYSETISIRQDPILN